MADIFEGRTDAHQSTERIPVTRFRPRYRVLSRAEKDLNDRLKAKAEELEALFEEVGHGPTRYKSLALTALEESVMWIVKELKS